MLWQAICCIFWTKQSKLVDYRGRVVVAYVELSFVKLYTDSLSSVSEHFLLWENVLCRHGIRWKFHRYWNCLSWRPELEKLILRVRHRLPQTRGRAKCLYTVYWMIVDHQLWNFIFSQAYIVRTFRVVNGWRSSTTWSSEVNLLRKSSGVVRKPLNLLYYFSGV